MAETIFERRAAAEEHYRRGLHLKQEGFLLEAEQEFRQSLEEDPAFFDPLLELLVDQEETGVSEDIRTDELLRRADQKYRLGMALLKHGRAEKAVRHLKAACLAENTNSKYHCGYGEALLAVGRIEEARETLRYAAEAHGGSHPRKYRARAHMLLGELYLKDGKISRARRRLLMAYAQDPKNDDIMALLKQTRVGWFRKIFILPRLLSAAQKRKSNW